MKAKMDDKGRHQKKRKLDLKIRFSNRRKIM
jgi:hypothetical protein